MILIKPFISEKSSKEEKRFCYTFSVDINNNKNQIKKRINQIFGVDIEKIRTMIYYRKNKSKFTKKGFLYGKTNKFKKVIVQLKKNHKIDFFDKKEI
ncbi:50S ribosomal protein L23 [Blattabacterium cuenoti]|uniref:50S ribosomal protein L23 n=1 Tax=Blattabacterium cuenoti TaxID=1653831 RepID=UPI00163C4191|nr:50S ribosomal protein L23 [Blattabacterium cuenoti]